MRLAWQETKLSYGDTDIDVQTFIAVLTTVSAVYNGLKSINDQRYVRMQ
jgi:hypothetical protein